MPGSVPFYPSQKYIQKGWKPEQVSLETLAALAKAQRAALQGGVLSPYLAQRLLPNALIEGRHDDMGLNNYGYPVTPQRDDRFRRLGLSVGRNPDLPPESANWGDQELEEWDMKHPSKFNIVPNVARDGYVIGSESPDVAAKVAAAMLAEKAAIYGEDKAIERWNGSGRKVLPKSGMVFADAPNHAAKVEALVGLLSAPQNAQLMKAYKGLLEE